MRLKEPIFISAQWNYDRPFEEMLLKKPIFISAERNYV